MRGRSGYYDRPVLLATQPPTSSNERLDLPLPGRVVRRPPIPPPLYVLGGVFSVQVGAAIATHLFATAGPAGTVWLRLVFAALVLVALARPAIRRAPRAALLNAAAFGLVLAAMNLCFYEAIDRLPLGVVVTVEFVGPLGVAVIQQRRALDVVWVMLAAGGVVLLSRGVAGEDVVGFGLALATGLLWAIYILLSARLGGQWSGASGLAVACVVAGVAMAPVGIASGGTALLHPGLLAAAAAVAVLSSAIPYALEMEALRRMPTATFGILMSLEPAAATLAGLVLIGQALTALELGGIALVVAASLGAIRSGVPEA